jgi:hypothetical protein
MKAEQALSLAIFAVNTLQHPDASSTEDVLRLDAAADDVLTALVRLRDGVPLLAEDVRLAQASAYGDSNDEEIGLLRGALEHACRLLDLSDVFDADYDPDTSDVRVRFQPEVWVRDQATSVDIERENEWLVSEDTAALIAHALANDTDLDFVRDDEFAPKWVKDWPGPFTIETVQED